MRFDGDMSQGGGSQRAAGQPGDGTDQAREPALARGKKRGDAIDEQRDRDEVEQPQDNLQTSRAEPPAECGARDPAGKHHHANDQCRGLRPVEPKPRLRVL